MLSNTVACISSAGSRQASATDDPYSSVAKLRFQMKTGNQAMLDSPSVTATSAYLFLFWIISCMIGVRISSSAKLILPPGTTRVFGRDMNES